jgi:Tfp pilus assembly protein FimT
VELLIAMALISMICVFGALRLGDSIEEHELSAAALALSADLRWLRQMSMNSPSGAGGPGVFHDV